MVILDPDKEGCAVYNDMMASYIKGKPVEVCGEVLHRVCCGVDHHGRPRQVITIGIVMGGLGAHYQDIFRGMELSHVVEIPSKHIGVVLPELCDRDCRGARE